MNTSSFDNSQKKVYIGDLNENQFKSKSNIMGVSYKPTELNYSKP